ncbi:TBC_domain-containing protein [Hexamita inflata]|uniref:TBC domain-containing protein n=1 Tax=Hexamita inflata TaxID=28002 RepID=A0AA86UZR4_9EUKA|nr:TBC domain-containing protein [Hexamita inflata]
MNQLNEKDQIELYTKIISGEPVSDWEINAFLCRPGQFKPKNQEQFLAEKAQLLKIRTLNQKKMQQIVEQFNIQKQCDSFNKYTTQQILSIGDRHELQDLVIEKGHIPCVYRSNLWPRFATQEVGSDVANFLSFLCTPAFAKIIRDRSIRNLNQVSMDDDEEEQQQIEVVDEIQEIVPKNQEDMALKFVLRNKLILNDINRTLSKTALFCENQPLFPVLCEVVSCAVVRYNRYVQGLSVTCALCLLFCSTKEDALALVFRITQSRIYQNFLKMNAETLNIYSQAVYKQVINILNTKEVQKHYKIKEINVAELNENVFQVMCASVTGLVLSGFGKAGAELACLAIDYLCFCDEKLINVRFLQLLVCFYAVKIIDYTMHGDLDQLLGELTKQLIFDNQEILMLEEMMRLVQAVPGIQEQITVINELVRYVD